MPFAFFLVSSAALAPPAGVCYNAGMKALVIVARGLQLSALSCYGNPWIDAPALDALAAEAVLFDRHFADALDPADARRVWRSGRYATPGGDLLASLRQ